MLAAVAVVFAVAGHGTALSAETPVDITSSSPHLSACYPEPALPAAPHLGQQIIGALTYDDWLARVITQIHGCDSLRIPEFAELRSPLDDPVVSSSFGLRLHPIRQQWLPHTGIDLVDREQRSRVPIHAAGAGVVAATGSFDAYGLTVIIDHGSRVATVYTHLSSIDVREGDVVDAGAQIGRLGATGVVTGPHLHFELRLGGAAVDPLQFVSPWREPPDGHP